MSSDEKRELPELQGWMTISLAAEKLKMARQSAHRLVNLGRLDAWRIPSAGEDRPLVVREEDVLKLMEERGISEVVQVFP